MSLTDSSNKIIYAGDGHTTAFDITPALPADSDGSDVYVYVVDNVGTVTLLSSNYTVDLNTLKVNYPNLGGVAPLGVGVNAVPVNWELVILRSEPLSQTLALTNQGIWDGPSIDAEFDKITMITQQLQEQLDRCFKGPVNLPGPASPVVPPPATPYLTLQTGTLAQLIVLSNATPLVAMFGTATDIGGGQLVWYPGYASTNGIQGSGWYAIGGGI